MKRFIYLFIPIVSAVVLLVIIAKVQLGSSQEVVKESPMNVDRLFVKVNEDSLSNAIAKAFGDNVIIKSGSGTFTIECENGFIIDHSQKGVEDIKLLENDEKKRFKCNYSGEMYTVTLKKGNGYVACPVMLLIPILNALKDKGVKYEDE